MISSIINRSKIAIYFLFLVCSFNASAQDELLSGLYFSSHEVIQDKRTSLNLTPHDYFKLSNQFSLEFEASFREGDGYYGYIFRLLGDNATNIDLVSNLASPTSNFWLVYKEQTLLTFKWDKLRGVGYNEWIKIKFDIDLPNSRASLSINDVKQEVSFPTPINTNLFNIVFGALHLQHFASVDVCPMSLKNVRIYNDGELCRYWSLSEHSNDQVFDEVKNAEASVSNPNWIIDRHVKWKKVKEFEMEGIMGSSHDTRNRRIFFINEKEIYCIYLDSLVVDTIPFLGSKPYNEKLARQIIYNEYFDQLWSYDFDNERINIFNFDTRTWSENSNTIVESLYAHQNRFISPVDSSLITISGYGHYTYSSAVHHYNRQSQSWGKIDRKDQIGPRYLSGSTVINNQTALIFGGYGSPTGHQELSPNFYYDLYQFDLNNYTFKKIWTLKTPETPFVPIETLVYDVDQNCFYTLIYNNMHHDTSLKLARFNIDDGEYVIFNDSIPYNFLDVESWTSLFLNKKSSELITYITTGSKVEIFSIAYPPRLKKNVLQKTKNTKFVSHIYWFVVLLVSLLCGFYIFKKNKRRKTTLQYEVPVDINYTEPIVALEQNKSASIYLLGTFKIIDGEGSDITSNFTPTTTQLFLLMLMNTIKNGKGTTSQELKSVLWFDMDNNSARNNRNVNINKLRIILKSFDKIKIINEDGYQTIKGLELVFCDYVRVQALINLLKNNPNFNKSVFVELVDLALSGTLLPLYQFEWLESYQSEYANSIIDTLLQYKDHVEVKRDFFLLVKIADAILLHDNIDEDAISIKCYALFHMGHKKQALDSFNKFATDYESLLAEKTKLIFDDLIK
ncbi:MAG: kelch repeat-containing protein [Parabacteroides sp.]|nr:kelch repeat-containing protein [Parabacteroides sp.]